jgi:radical SAM protein with 4Fe4S-binding SPASM domain
MNDIPFRLKTMVLKSNIDEFDEIRTFCKKLTKDYFHFDFQLHLRTDQDQVKNRTIIAERLSPEVIAGLESDDKDRSDALKKECDILINMDFNQSIGNKLFKCGVANSTAFISYDGMLRLCQSLIHKDFTVNIREIGLMEGFKQIRDKAQKKISNHPDFLNNCNRCPYINLCMWCPAMAHLETGQLDAKVEYFCDLAHARAARLKK